MLRLMVPPLRTPLPATVYTGTRMAEELPALDPLLPLLGKQPLGIVSDIDGTLSPIVPDPEEARITPRCLALLHDLLARGVRVALVTGRALEKARSMARVEGVAFAANHGLNLWIDGKEETLEEARDYAIKAGELLRDIRPLDHVGVTIEDKGPVLAFHYRRAPDPGTARSAILDAIRASPLSSEFQLQEGRKLIELRPPLPLDKGTALQALARRLHMAAILCLGDDTTDLDMFRGVRELRESGEVPGTSVAVAGEEAAPVLMEAADYWVRGVEGVEWLLGEVLRALPSKAT